MKTVAVIPARNEEKKIGHTLSTLQTLNLYRVIVVANGCEDNTIEEVKKSLSPADIIFFQEPLGHDVPRAVGAFYALRLHADSVVFLDADMTGPLTDTLGKLIHCIKDNQVDMALVNCYPYIHSRDYFVSFMLYFRALLNRKLGFFNKLGLATPSHGPHAVSSRTLKRIPLVSLAKPPVSLLYAVQNQLKIQVCASFPHAYLGSTARDNQHIKNIFHTVIGDCLEAIALLENKKPKREYMGIDYVGYDSCRRYDILNDILNGKRKLTIIHNHYW